jgi:hypothetical protein
MLPIQTAIITQTLEIMSVNEKPEKSAPVQHLLIEKIYL